MSDNQLVMVTYFTDEALLKFSHPIKHQSWSSNFVLILQATIDLPHGLSPRSAKPFHSTMTSVRQRAIDLDGTPTEVCSTLRQEASAENEIPRNTAMVKYAKSKAIKLATSDIDATSEGEDEEDDAERVMIRCTIFNNTFDRFILKDTNFANFWLILPVKKLPKT